MMKRLSIFLAAIILLTILCSCGQNNNSLIGAWYNDEEGVVCIFSEDGDWTEYMLDVSYNGNPELEIYTSKYILTDSNHITIEEQNNVSACTYTYQISNNTLQLTIEDIDFHFSLTRAKNTTDASNMIVGNWRLLSAEYAGDTYYTRNLYDITFFSDGTFKGIRDNKWNEREEVEGSYSLIHDGTTLEMAFPISGHQSITFPCDDVMILSTDYGELLYIAQ